jgi:hypothetical protein
MFKLRAYSWILRPVYTGPQVLSLKSVEVNPCSLNCCEHGSWDLQLHTRFQILSPKFDMDSHIATPFWEVRFGTCVKSWIEQKARPNSQYKSHEYFCIKNKDPTLMIINHISMVSRGSKVGTLRPCWDLLTWVGLGDPMWTDPHCYTRRFWCPFLNYTPCHIPLQYRSPN